ncbi:phosphoribosylpyrophosphate synthetase [Foetidibacter luteolus]|uniref:phosphoribosylpyrophosphate synthetase n=1 Tax=Foetidibacter luteolus TaxID=2608880 RepID=UPI00129A46ED|nr:phosphoribosylpyrophosphate synthetase [Foetidibacter luteolus]
MQAYDTLTEALSSLKQQGYTTDFNLAFDKVKCAETGVCLSPSQFEITGYYRFEGQTDPGDSAALYVIESHDSAMKGTLVSAYGAYSDAVDDEMLRKLSVHH